MGKGQQCNYRTSTPRSSDNVLSRDVLKTGELMFVDQFESRIKRRLSFTKEKESEALQYVGDTIFVDATTVFAKHTINLLCVLVISYKVNSTLKTLAENTVDQLKAITATMASSRIKTGLTNVTPKRKQVHIMVLFLIIKMVLSSDPSVL